MLAPESEPLLSFLTTVKYTGKTITRTRTTTVAATALAMISVLLRRGRAVAGAASTWVSELPALPPPSNFSRVFDETEVLGVGTADILLSTRVKERWE